MKGEYTDPSRFPLNIEFYGIGLRAGNFKGHRLNTLYYDCAHSLGWPRQKKPFFETENVIYIIRDMQSEALKELNTQSVYSDKMEPNIFIDGEKVVL